MTQSNQSIERDTLNRELIRYRRAYGAKAFDALLTRLGVERPQDIATSEFERAISECRAGASGGQEKPVGKLKAIALASADIPTALKSFATAIYGRKT